MENTLKRVPGVIQWLEQLRAAPAPRPRSRSGAKARELGLTEDLVEYKGRTYTTSRAAARLGPEWFRLVTFTGLETLSEKGLQILDSRTNLD